MINELVQVRLDNRNIQHYLNLGYNGKNGDYINVLSSHLTLGSNTEVKVICDYCGSHSVKKYKIYKKGHKDLEKDACSKCRGLKAKEVGLVCYGIENRTWTDEAKLKRNNTNLERYGSLWSVSNEYVQEKRKRTNLKKYGYENPMLNESVKERNRNSRINGEFNNKGIPISKQQRYIHDVVGGELNYPLDNLYLDIAFEEEKIYIEFQGSGHDLSVQLNKISEEKFNNKEIKRYYYLKNRNWKMIEIISKNDHVPTKDKLMEMMSFSREVLSNSSYIVFDIDNFKVKVDGSWNDYDFGELIAQWTLRRSFERGTYDEQIENDSFKTHNMI